MILPYQYRKDIEHLFCVDANIRSALFYQMNKLVFCCKKVEKIIDNNPTNFQYITKSDEFLFYIDDILNSYASLIEYYHSFVINCLIGNINPTRKISYIALKESNINTRIEHYDIGVLPENCKNEQVKAKFRKESQQIFKDAFSSKFILDFKINELTALNNYIKHNSLLASYAPEIVGFGKKFRLPYIYINNFFINQLSECILKDIASLNQDISEFEDELSKRQNNYYIHQFGGEYILSIECIDFVKFDNTTGVNVESILCISYNLIEYIIEIYKKYNEGNVTEIQKLNKMLNQIKERAPNTIYNLKKTK